MASRNQNAMSSGNSSLGRKEFLRQWCAIESNSNWKLINWFERSRMAEKKRIRWVSMSFLSFPWNLFDYIFLHSQCRSSLITSHSLSSVMLKQQQRFSSVEKMKIFLTLNKFYAHSRVRTSYQPWTDARNVEIEFQFYYYSARNFFLPKWDVIKDICVQHESLQKNIPSCIKVLYSKNKFFYSIQGRGSLHFLSISLASAVRIIKFISFFGIRMSKQEKEWDEVAMNFAQNMYTKHEYHHLVFIFQHSLL